MDIVIIADCVVVCTFDLLVLVYLSGMVKSIHGTYKLPYHPEGPDGPEYVIDFTPPFKRLHMFPDLEKAMGVTLPPPHQLDTPEAARQLDQLCVKNGVECTAPRTVTRLLDKVTCHETK